MADTRYREKKPKPPRYKWMADQRPYHYVGNVTSDSGARPHGRVHIPRIAVTAENRDVVRHWVVDVRVTDPLCRKTGCPRFESLRPLGPNVQRPMVRAPPPKKPQLPRVVQVAPQLFLANLAFVEQPDAVLRSRGITDLLNLTDRPSTSELPSYHYPLVDERQLDFRVFRQQMLRLTTHLQDLLSQGRVVCVYCRAGVNRAPTVVVAYQCRQGADLDATVWALEQQQRRCDPAWDTLTNRDYMHHLGLWVAVLRGQPGSTWASLYDGSRPGMGRSLRRFLGQP